MKRLAALLMLVAAPRLFAATTTNIQLAVNESRQLQMIGVTAAWAVDTTIVDAGVINGGVALHGRSAGRTRVIVISVTGENTLDVVVEAPPMRIAAPSAAKTGDRITAEARYTSATREVHNSVTVVREDAKKRTQLDVRTIHQTSSTFTDRARTSVPVVSYGIFTRNRELTLLDRDVMHSPLTLFGTPLRGIHYLDEHWRVHAGVTAYATYQSFLVPVERETVAGAAYAFRTGARSSVMPGLFYVRGQGTIASLLYDHQRDTSQLRAELGMSEGIGAAVQYWLDTRRDQARVDVRYRPRNFAVVGPGDVRGLRADASWSHAYGRGSSVAAIASAAEYARTNERVLAASVDVDQRLNDRVSLLGGASWASFDGVESLTVPAGVDLHFNRGGITALYRYSESRVNRGGHGGRLAARASLGRLYFTGYADRQQNVATLDVLFGEQPDLAIALAELGITATTPADVARALREHQALAELGFIDGVTVDFAPMRTQFGLEAAWLGASAARHQLRARLLHNVIEGVASRHATTIASLSYSRRITDATDVFAGYTYWRHERRGQQAETRPYVEVGVRQRFDSVPSFGGGGTISGVVFADENLDGVSDGTGVSAEVELNGTTQQTDADGKFAFRNVGRGSQRVSARVTRPDAYFTTPSRVEAQSGDTISFGVATTPARVAGRVMNDAGRGIANVRVTLTRGTKQVQALTDSEGAFTVATAPGEWDIAVVPDSIPSGYSLGDLVTQSVMLDRNVARKVEWQLRALRSVSGTGAPPNSEIVVEPIGKRVRTDGQGRFSLRSLPAGELTIIAGNTRRTVTLASDPTSTSIDFGVAIAPPPAPSAVQTIVSGEHRDTMGYMVQIGAFRVRSNAEETLKRARRSGVDAKLHASGSLFIVSAGPYATREAAAAVVQRLEADGLDAVITSRK